MKWTFAKNEGGEEKGFHDAGVETFKGNFERYLAREVIQNSLDARSDTKKAVAVKFERMEIDAADIPDLEGLADTFRYCAQYWKGDKKAQEFFKRAEKAARGSTVVALRIGDRNTTGLLGDDKDRTKNWYNLIRCSGSSSKWEGEGGSFGIGKNAPFAASRLRAVFYSTFNSEKEHAFQGVARLATHERPYGTGKALAQATGYLGGDKGASVREKKKIPRAFLRSEQGTDLIILGYHADKTWHKDLVYSVLDNFWPAIHFGDLSVVVGDTEINKKTLPSLLESNSAEKGFTAHLYYRAFTTSDALEYKEKLPTLQNVSVHLLAGLPDLPKKVAMVRKTGMVIYQKPFRSVVPFCGVFLCRNNEGNRHLRDMEPPRHDEWDPDHPEKGMHRKTADEFNGFIRECIKALAPANAEKVLTIPELSQFLPDDEDSPDEHFDAPIAEQLSKNESFDRKPSEAPIQGRKMKRDRPSRPSTVQPGEEDIDLIVQGDEENDDEGEEQGEEGEPNDNGGGIGSGKGGPSELKKGQPGGANTRPTIRAKFRAFPKDLSTGSYIVTVTPEERVKATAMLHVSAVGDDAKAAVGIASARLISGVELKLHGRGLLGPVKFPDKGPLRIEVVLREPERLALEVSVHEA